MRILSLCLLLFINAMSIGLVFPIFAPLFTQSTEPLFAADTPLALQTLCYSFILAIPTFCMIFGAPFLGGLSDRYGRRKVLLIGLFGLSVSFLLSAIGIAQGSLLLLFVSRALAGLMDGSESIAQAAIVDYSTPQTKAKNMSYATFAGTIGFIIGPVIGGLLAERSLTGRFHYEIPFIASLLLTLLNMLALKTFLPKDNIHPKEVNISYFRLLFNAMAICCDKRIRGFSLLLFVLQGCLACFFQLSTLLLAEKYLYSSGEIGLFTTFLGACFSGGIFFVIHALLPRVRYLTLLRMGISLIGIALISAILLHDSAMLAWISVVPLMLGISMMYNVLIILISNSVTEHELGEAMGSGTAVKALAWLMSSVMISCFYPNVLALLGMLLSVVILALLSTLHLVCSEAIA